MTTMKYACKGRKMPPQGVIGCYMYQLAVWSWKTSMPLNSPGSGVAPELPQEDRTLIVCNEKDAAKECCFADSRIGFDVMLDVNRSAVGWLHERIRKPFVVRRNG